MTSIAAPALDASMTAHHRPWYRHLDADGEILQVRPIAILLAFALDWTGWLPRRRY